jgi:hypothetical protein
MNGLVPITVKPRFIGFEGFRQHRLPEGMTLLEMATEISGDLTPEFWNGHGVICVGDRRVPQEMWGMVKPRVVEGREIAVTFHVVPMGGERTAGILVTLAGVALIAAGAAFNQGWLIGLGIGVTLSGVSMLLAPPPPQVKEKEGSDAQAIQAGIQSNPPAPFEWLPRVLGRMVGSPLPLIRAYSVYSRGVVSIKGAVGYVGRHEITDVRVNGALADSMENFTYEVREGAPGDTALTIGNDWVWEESPRMQLIGFDLDSTNRQDLFDQSTPANSTPKFQTFLTRSGTPSKVVIRLLFPQGMSYDGGSDTEGAIPVRVEFRAKGSSTWILGPEFHFWDEGSGSREIRQNIEFKWQASDTLIGPWSDFVAWVAYFRAQNGNATEYEADSYFSNGSSDYCRHCYHTDDGFVVHLDPSTFPPGDYEFRIKRGLVYRKARFTASAYTYDDGGGASVANARFFDYTAPLGTYIVSFEQTKFRGDVQVEAFQTWVDEYPLQDALDGGVPLSLIGFEAKNMEIQSIAATFESVVNTWDGVDWDTVAASRNPAALYRHVLIDSLNADPRDAAIVNSGVLEDWYDHCVSKGYNCDAIVSDNEPQILALIASAGWASPRSHEQWDVVIEKPRAAEPITQNFTPLNSSNYRAIKAFADLPHAFNVEYASADDDNAMNTVIVYADGYNADGSGGNAEATRFETIRMDGITDEAAVEARALGILRALYGRQTERQIDVGIEALCSRRGDVVGVSHDLRDQYVWYGIVEEVLTSGPNVTGLRLNGKALLSETTGPFSAVIRYMDQTVVIKAISESTDTTTLTFVTPFTIPSDDVLRKGCLASIGVSSSVVRRQIVSGITYKDEFTATISLMDEAQEIFGLSTALLEQHGGLGLAIVAADDSMTIAE